MARHSTYILGDSATGLRPHSSKPFSIAGRTPDDVSTCATAEHGGVEGRVWDTEVSMEVCLDRLDAHLGNVQFIVFACCPHNMCGRKLPLE
jgi:hypothetical protein